MSNGNQNSVLSEAMRLHQQGRFDDARIRYQKLLASNPDNDRVIFLLANLDASVGEFEQARQAFERAAQINPTAVDYQLCLGEVYGRLGRFNDASNVFKKALELAPDNPDVHSNLGIALASMQQFDEAGEHFARVMQARPDDVTAHHHYAACLNECGRTADAISALENLLAQKPDDVQALQNLGVSYLNQGVYEKAIEYLGNAVKNNPEYAPTRCKLAFALNGRGRYPEALDHAMHALRLAPDQAEPITIFGSIQIALGHYDVAMDSFQRAWSLDNHHSGAICGLAECYRLNGDWLKAEELLRPSLDRERPDTEIVLAWAKLMRGQKRPDDAISIVERALAYQFLSHAARVQLNFSLGQLLHQRRDFEQAWGQFETASKMKGTDFDRVQHTEAVSVVINEFDANAMRTLPRSNCVDERPVFVVGMPRVGKTIVEQIIAAHPDVYGAGELSVIGALSANIKRLTNSDQPYPLNIGMLDSTMLDTFASEYLACLARDAGDATRISDTMPMNFFHIGFIELIFPKSRIIHCTRNPYDMALACFSKDFRDPFVNFSCSLDDIVSFYADYRRLTEHFRSVSSLAWLDISYEKLVSDTETQSRKLIDFLGLEWNSLCARFYEDHVPTMSSPDRLRSPLNNKEIGWADDYPKIVDFVKQNLPGIDAHDE